MYVVHDHSCTHVAIKQLGFLTHVYPCIAYVCVYIYSNIAYSMHVHVNIPLYIFVGNNKQAFEPEI